MVLHLILGFDIFNDVSKMLGKKKPTRIFDSEFQGVLSQVHRMVDLYSQLTKLFIRYDVLMKGEYMK